MKLLTTILFVFVTSSILGQNFGQVSAQELSSMPEPVANNAVVGGWANDTAYVYSFGGIDSTKVYSGIHLKSWRYNTVTDIWDTIPTLPDTLGKIAAGASWVDSIIYIIGGYHVYANSNEASSAKVHRFDPRTNTYLSDGADIPVPIDDHVQAVWNDSLIYVITGWSNTGNVPNVQIYDPANDTWYVGDPVPTSSLYMAFGATGIIINNTIYYHGGARNGFNFPGTNAMRIGQINPSNPIQITWTYETTSYVSYRAVAVYDWWVNKPFIVGGSSVTYNYNGIAYNGSGGVEPKGFSLSYDSFMPTLFGSYPNSVSILSPPSNDTILPMDLRGVAFPFGSNHYIAGGMWRNQQVTDKVFKFTTQHAMNIESTSYISEFVVYPNPFSDVITISFKTADTKTMLVYDLLGNQLITNSITSAVETIDISYLPAGIYLIQIESEKGVSTQKIIKQ